MEILILSDYSGLAIDINNELNKLGYRSQLISSNIPKGIFKENLTEISYTPIKKLDRLITISRSFFYRYLFLRTTGRYSYYQDIHEGRNYFAFDKLKKRINIQPDAIFILFDYRIVTTRTINLLHTHFKVPIFWFLVDMKPMTGGCSYAFECTNYQTDCVNCPAITSIYAKNYARNTLNNKVKNLNQVDLNIVTFSSEQFEQSISSKLFKFAKHFKYYFPISSEKFNPGNKLQAKINLDFPVGKKIIFIGANNFADHRKGFKYLKEALLLISHEKYNNILLVIAGRVSKSKLKDIKIDKVFLGNLSSEELAKVFQSAHFFVCPSIADSGPTMVNQSIMCATPVVSFDVGICKDLIINKITGVIVKKENIIGLYSGMKYMLELDNNEYEIMRNNCIVLSKKMQDENLMNNLKSLLN